MLYTYSLLLSVLVSLTRSQSFDLPLPDATTLTSTSSDFVSRLTNTYTPITGQIDFSTSLRLQKRRETSVRANSANPTKPGAGRAATPVAPKPSNKRACNGHPEFCTRKYMNVTEVGAHNAAFVRKNNVAANQVIPILGQLNDGIRMIQGETLPLNGTMYSCHTNCDLFNAGTLKDELASIRQWVVKHPYDVLTLLFVNRAFVDVEEYVRPILDSGLGPFLYRPPKVPMHRNDWPTYGQMIVSGKRVVVFLDYRANQTNVPFILDQFQHMWETPFSPTDINFPCDQNRPPGLNSVQQNLVPYIANHNLDVKLTLGSTSIDIPNFTELNQVNSVNGLKGRGSVGSLGQTGRDCTQRWGRPPAWLLVDYYNYGDKNGSVFEAAAQMNGVKYTKNCCGEDVSARSIASSGFLRPSVNSVLALVIAVGALML